MSALFEIWEPLLGSTSYLYAPFATGCAAPAGLACVNHYSSLLFHRFSDIRDEMRGGRSEVRVHSPQRSQSNMARHRGDGLGLFVVMPNTSPPSPSALIGTGRAIHRGQIAGRAEDCLHFNAMSGEELHRVVVSEKRAGKTTNTCAERDAMPRPSGGSSRAATGKRQQSLSIKVEDRGWLCRGRGQATCRVADAEPGCYNCTPGSLGP